MSNTERAPEPTMEEILASIRRIITDDEAGQAPQKTAKKPEAEDEGLDEGEADSEIIDDIARVLSGSADGGAAADTPTSEDEIMDLTSELGGLEMVEEYGEAASEPAAVEVVEEVLELEEIEFLPDEADATASAPEEAPQPDEMPQFKPEPMPEPEPTPEQPPMALDDETSMEPDLQPTSDPVMETDGSMEAEAPMELDVAMEPEPMEPEPMEPEPMEREPMQAEVRQPPPVPEPAPKPSASEEAASALERAIAALRAGQVPTSTTPPAEPFQFQAAPQPDALTPEEEQAEFSAEAEMPASDGETQGEAEAMAAALPMATPMPPPEPEAETHPEPAGDFEPPHDSFEAQPEGAPTLDVADLGEEPELVLNDVEMTIEDSAPEAESQPFWPFQASEAQVEEPEADAAPEPKPVFDTALEAEAEQEPEPLEAQVNGGAHHDVAGRTLEDAIKDMLRPMLRQWLDENMPRMIRDELDPETLRRLQD